MFYILLAMLWALSLVGLPQQHFWPTNPLVVHVHEDDYRDQILDKLPETFWVRHVAFQVDGRYRADDIALLAGVADNQKISRLELLSALFYMRQLGLFESIELEVDMVGKAEFDLKIVLRQRVVLDYLKVTGFLRNKQVLKNLYVMDPGDVFDQSKHDHSIEHMKTVLKEQGYLDAQIHDLILAEKNPKNVVVRCGVMHGSRFRIGSIQTTVDCAGNIDAIDLSHLSTRLSYFLSKKLDGKYYTSELLALVEHKVRVLLTHEGFIDVGIYVEPETITQQSLVNLTVKIVLEKKREFVVWGNSFFKRDQILEHLLLYGKSTWHFPGSIIVDEIEQFYKNKGFWNVRVSVKEEPSRIFCFVQEGARVSIEHVRIVHSSFPDAQFMVQSSFRNVVKHRFYDKETVKKALEHLVKSYKAAGFWDIKVCKEQFMPLQKSNTYEYAIMVDEGVRRLVGNCTVQTTHHDMRMVAQDRDFEELCLKNKGRGFDRAILHEQQQWLAAYAKRKGYQGVAFGYDLVVNQAQPQLVSQEGQHHNPATVQSVDIVWNITHAAPVIKFGKTMLLGNAKIAYDKLLKECAYQEGDDWDKQKLESTLKNLKSILLFESIQIYPGRELDEFSQKPVFIKITEADRYEIKSRFGLQQVGKNLQLKRGFTYKVGGSFTMHRLCSSVDTWTASADITRFYRDLEMTYDVPWLKNLRARSQSKGYDTLYLQPVFPGSQVSLYKATRQGILWNLVYNHKKMLLSNSCGIEWMGLYETDQPSLDSIICYDKELLGHRIGYLSIEPSALWRQVDNELSPQSGFVSFASCKAMFDFNNKTTFCRVLAEHTQYLPVTDSITAALRFRAGHFFNRQFSQMHPVERFYLGGPSSIRGYDRDYCPPFGLLTKPVHDAHAGLPLCANDVWRYAPQGGRTMFNFNAELRCGVYKNVGVVLFTDAGALFQDSVEDELRCDERRTFAGSGVGIRYDTPIGPLRIDIGFKWHIQKPDFESRHVWSISLGHAF